MTRRDDDLAIPPEIEARLRSVDDSLPPTPAWRSPGEELPRLRAVPVRRASRGPSIGAVLVAVAILVAVVVAIGRLPASPATNGPVIASASPALGSPNGTPEATPGATPDRSPDPSPAAVAIGSAIEVLRGDVDGGDGESLIVPRFGCNELVGADAFVAWTYDGADVDRAALAAGIEDGWLDVPVDGGRSERVWLGEDVVALAVDTGSPLVAVGDRGVVWLSAGRRASQWLPLVTPRGRTAWRIGGSSVAAADTCPPPPSPLPTVHGVRSFTCGISREECVAAIEAARAAEPDAFTGTTDAAVAPVCGPGMRCGYSPVPGAIVAAVPAAWRGLDDVRAFEVGGPDEAHRVATAMAGALPAHVVDLVARPARSLLVSDAPPGGVAQGCRLARLAGTLTGSPWDDWVARVAGAEVRWPAGFRARFVPRLELLDANGAVFAGEGDTVELAGGIGAESADGFIACIPTP